MHAQAATLLGLKASLANSVVQTTDRPKEQHSNEESVSRTIVVRRIELDDVIDAIRKGFKDFHESRTDILFLCFVYPIIGLIATAGVSSAGYAQMAVPLVSGFVLVGPALAIGLYELSRRHERGLSVRWADMFSVLRSPAIHSIMGLAWILVLFWMTWVAATYFLYRDFVGDQMQTSIVHATLNVLETKDGLLASAFSLLIGAVLATLALAISVVSFPLMLDLEVGLRLAVLTSINVVRRNPIAIAMWGLLVLGGLIMGFAFMIVGLVVVLPILGHGTWHLYRKLIVAPDDSEMELSAPHHGFQ